jgi:hypothetical protein
MTADHGYTSPAAFRRALTDRLGALAKQGKWTLTQLQRQMAYDRLLERCWPAARQVGIDLRAGAGPPGR